MRSKVRLQKAITENMPLKIAALIIAVILWLFVISKGQTEVSFGVPIEFVNIPKGLDIVKCDVKSVSVVVRGYEMLIKNIKEGDIRLLIDMSKIKKGESRLTIRKEDIHTPFNVSIIKIEPSSLRVVLEERVSKKVFVRPVLTGIPGIGYYVSSIQTNPKEITIEGVRSEIRRINYINTEPLDITGIREDLTEVVGLDLSGGKVKLERDKVEIVIRIKRKGK